MIYDQLIPKLQKIQDLKEIDQSLFFQLLEATMTSGMAIRFNDPKLNHEKIHDLMVDVKDVVNQYIDQNIEELKEDNA